MFGRKGGGGGGNRIELSKKSTSGSHLDTREVAVVVVASNQWKKKTTLGSCLDAREVDEGADGSKRRKNFLQLAFGHEGGGRYGRGVERTNKTTSGSHLDAREVVEVADASKEPKKTTSGSHLDAREVDEVGGTLKC